MKIKSFINFCVSNTTQILKIINSKNSSVKHLEWELITLQIKNIFST